MTNEILRALAMEARELTAPVEEGKATPATKKAKAEPTFSVTLAEYPDLIVTRVSPKMTKHLVILFTAGTAFIKTEQNGKDSTSELLNEENYCKFTANMRMVPLPDGYWAAQLKKGKEFYARLDEALHDEEIREAMKRGYLKEFGSIENRNDLENMKEVKTYLPKLLPEYCGNQKCMHLMKNHYILLADIQQRFGLQNARDFLDAYTDSLATLNNDRWSNTTRWNVNTLWEDENIGFHENQGGYYVSTISKLPYVKMDYKAFKDYVLYDSVRYGYGDDIASFLDTWVDTLNMQFQVYRKIKEKYPADLPLYHNQIAYKARLMRQEINGRNFAANVEKAKRFEGECDKYVFTVPKTKQDFYDEATTQCNCLASYVDKFAEGRCEIVFMRKKDSPDVSFVTIEVVGGDCVNQAKLARNVNPPREIRELIEQWVAHCNAAGKKEVA